MGGTVPRDSVATGTITTNAGGSTESGTIRILTRGIDQTSEETQFGESSRKDIYSRGLSAIDEGTSSSDKSLEWAATAQSAYSPLNLIAGALASSDTAYEYLGLVEVDGGKLHHIRFWNSFQSTPNLRHLAEFSVREVWVDEISGLPQKLSYDQRDGSGAVDRVRFDITFSEYRNVGGVLYPFLVEKAINGSPWTTVRIERITLSNGLSDTNFPTGRTQQ